MKLLLSVTLEFGQINVFEYQKRLLSLLQDVKKEKLTKTRLDISRHNVAHHSLGAKA